MGWATIKDIAKAIGANFEDTVLAILHHMLEPDDDAPRLNVAGIEVNDGTPVILFATSMQGESYETLQPMGIGTCTAILPMEAIECFNYMVTHLSSRPSSP